MYITVERLDKNEEIVHLKKELKEAKDELERIKAGELPEEN